MFDQRELQRIWYGGRRPPWPLQALAVLYRVVVALRAALNAAGILTGKRLAVPVVVVGNITVGGAGKTPLTIALVAALRERGLRPGVVSRGYGGTADGATMVDAAAAPATVGDEPCMIAQATAAPVAVGRARVAAGRLLLATAPDTDVLIADDGLQHLALGRDVEICVIDGERRFGNGRLLPAGPLREPLARLDRVDFRVCNGGTPAAGEVAMTLVGDAAVALADPALRQPLAAFAGKRVHGVAGIGNPARFFSALRASGIDVIEHAFGDHHPYVAADLDFGDELPVLMTQKDAIKVVAFADRRHWCVPVRAQLPAEFLDAVAARVRAATTARG